MRTSDVLSSASIIPCKLSSELALIAWSPAKPIVMSVRKRNT